jgi:Uma2 family endonuclease
MALSVTDRVRPLRREEYEKLTELGAFQDERIELLDGVMVAMTPIGAPHSSAVQSLAELLILALHGRAKVFCQAPFAALEASEPEPDLMVVPLGEYHEHHASIAYLIAEVADSSLLKDLTTKLSIYARAKVPEYWMVDVENRRVEVFREPSLESYREHRTVEHAGSLSPAAFPDVVVRVANVIK